MSEFVITWEGFGQAITTDKAGNIIYRGETLPKYVVYDRESRGLLEPYLVTYENVDVDNNKLISTTKLPATITGSINNVGPVPIEVGKSESIPRNGENFSNGEVTFNTYYIFFTPEGQQEAAVLGFIYSSGLIGPNKDLYYASCDVVQVTNVEEIPSNSRTNNISKYSKFFIQNFQKSINPLANIKNYVHKNPSILSSNLHNIHQKLHKSSLQVSNNLPQQNSSLSNIIEKLQKSSLQVSNKIPQQQSKSKKKCNCKNKNKK
jgi:hypothetical protein